MATEQWRKDNIEKLRAYRRLWYKNNSEHAKKKVISRKKDLKLWLKDLKSKLKCERCPEDHVSCLDFHHIDPSAKEVNISEITQLGWSKEHIQEEIDKCIVLCANCHRKEHFKLNIAG